jgi:ubiquinone/menaquinone biosynthesis C-methylase UbiE
MTSRFAALTLASLSWLSCAGPAPSVAADPVAADPVAADSPPIGSPADINERFRSPELDIERFVDLFESETREVALARHSILAALGLRPGEAVADVGAGTGLFLDLFCDVLGPDGELVCVDISEVFLEHLDERIREAGLTQARTLLCDDRSSGLREASMDLVFICDTYHHFEYPSDTLASLHAALKPGGRLVLVDLERKPGVSSDWILGHVRADKQTFRAEIEAAGFQLAREAQLAEFRMSYMLIFDRVGSTPDRH